MKRQQRRPIAVERSDKPDDVIAVCHICGGELTRADDEASLIIWVHPPDYNVTGVKEPYCRGCAEDAAQHPLT